MFSGILVSFMVMLVALSGVEGGSTIWQDLTFGPTLLGVSQLSTNVPTAVTDLLVLPSQKYIGAGTYGAQSFVGQLTHLGNLDIFNYNYPTGIQFLQFRDVTVAKNVVMQSTDTITSGNTQFFTSGDTSAFLTRVTSVGALDTTDFNSPDGYVLYSVPSLATPEFTDANDVQVQVSNGYLVTVGTYHDDTSTDQTFVARHDDNGAIDTTFGTGGLVTPNLGAYSVGVALAIQPADEFILVLSNVADGSGGYLPTMQRYDTTGVLDTAFGTGGVQGITTLVSMHGVACLLQKNGGNAGKIIVLASQPSGRTAVIVRLNADGSRDTSFADFGVQSITFPGDSVLTMRDLTLTDDGTDGIVAVGSFDPSSGHAVVIKLLDDGTLDPNFGSEGVQDMAPGINALDMGTVATDDHRILVAGSESIDVFAFALKDSISDFVTFTSPTAANPTLDTNQIYMTGVASQANAKIQLLVDDVDTNIYVVTNNRGLWNAGTTIPLVWSTSPGTDHTITANLIYDSDIVLATDSVTVHLQIPS